MTMLYPDPVNGNVPVPSRTDDNDEEVPGHDVLKLPGTVETDIESIRTGVTAVGTSLTTLIGHVDGLEALGTALNGFVDGLEGLLGTTNTTLTTLNGYVDGLEALQTTIGGYLDTVETKLQAIIDNQAVPSGGPKFGYVSGIGTGSNTKFASKTLVRGCVIYNLDATNNLLISLGTPGAADADTFTLKPGTASPFIAIADPNTLNMRSNTSTVSACYVGA